MKGQKVSIDLRIVSGVLAVLVLVMLGLWRPWQGGGAARTIEIVGEASVEAEPDEFQFNPTYQFKNADRTVAQKELVAKVNTVVNKLKELGVAESDITLASSTYDNFWKEGEQEVTSNTLTITIRDNEMSQKVQDYLLTTAPEGQLSPMPTFSNKKQDEIEEEARDLALDDAKSKAEKTAAQLGLKIGKVIAIDDQQNGNIVFPMYGRGEIAVAADSMSSSLPVLPGKQDISYTITVTYELK